MLAGNKENKRVVLIVPIFPQVSETFIAHKTAALLEKGWDLHVVCSRSQDSDWDFYPELRARSELIRRVHVNWPHTPRWLELLFFPFAFFKCAISNSPAVFRYLGTGFKKLGLLQILNNLYLDSTLIALKPDLIHFEFGDLAKKRMHLKRLLGCKISVSFRGHDLNFVGLDDPNFYKEIWEDVDAIHFLGRDLLARSRNRGFQGSIGYFMISPAIDSRYFKLNAPRSYGIVGTKQRPLRILSAARLSWTKGYEYGLQAVRLLIDKGIQFEYRIIGDGSHKEAVLFAIDDLGLREHVKLLLSQPQSEVKVQMEWADVFLHPSVSEGFSNVVLEAQSMELPVICSDSDGLRENVEDGFTGYVVARRDPLAMSEKLSLLSRDSNLRMKMGQAGRKRIITHFLFEDRMIAWDRFFRSALHLSDISVETVVSEQPARAIAD